MPPIPKHLNPETTGALSEQLSHWVEAGLIESGQAAAILDFERARSSSDRRRAASRGIALLGALTIVAGLASVVAFNWDAISNPLKLVCMGAILAIAALMAYQKRDDTSWAYDVAALIYSGCSLGSLALVSQIYDQDGELWMLLCFWNAINFPVLMAVRGRFANLYWYVGMWVAMIAAGPALVSALDSDRLARDDNEVLMVLLQWGAGLIGAHCFRHSSNVLRSAIGQKMALWHLAVLGAVAPFAWSVEVNASFFVVVVGVLLCFFVYGNLRFRGGDWHDGPLVHELILLCFGVMNATCALALDGTNELVSFLSHLIFWGLAWAFAERNRSFTLVRACVAMIGFRVLIASFQLFESLLISGVVLIGLGGAALLIAKKNSHRGAA